MTIRGRLLGCGFAACGLILAIAGCEEHQSQRVSGCKPACSDAQCKRFDICKANEDCPIGTSCAQNVCRPSVNLGLSGTVLVEGFGSDEIALTRSQSGAFSVEAPKVAVNVSCALFIGLPAFKDGALTNLGASVARYQVFPLDPSRTQASTVGLNLDDLKPLQSKDCAVAPALDTGRAGAVLVESLRLGCWAMSQESVVAASHVLNLDPSELPEYGVKPLDSCNQASGATDGSACVRSAQIGTCQNHDCFANDGGAPDAGSPDASAPIDTELCQTAGDGTPCALGSAEPGRCYGGNCIEREDVLPPLINADCTSSVDWENCFPSPLGLVGSCFNSHCRQRCHDETDCNAGDACKFPPHASYLGLCKGSQEQAP